MEMTTKSYDYIVVGGGSAGCVVAGRLAQHGDARVLLLEAGRQADDDRFSVPLLWPRSIHTSADWNLISDPEPHLYHRQTPLPRGKVLGGSSAINAMLYVRGVREDFDDWTGLGLSAWTWNDVFPEYLASENNTGIVDEFHGVGGPWTISNRVSTSPFIEAWVQANMDVGGLACNHDFNGARRDGVGFFQLAVSDGRRQSSADAFLDLPGAKPEIITNAEVARVEVEHGRATAVWADVDDEVVRIVAEQEVVICAGAYNTPKLLMLSGIGHADHLKGIGVTPLVDLPVGDDLQDHAGGGVIFAVPEYDVVPTAADRDEFDEAGTGRFVSNRVEAGSFLRVAPGATTPDVESIVEGPNGLAPGRAGVFVEVLKPASRGTVRLRSDAPDAMAVIQHNHLQAQSDRDLLVAGLRHNLDILDGSGLVPKEARAVWPSSCSDDDLLDHLRLHGRSLYHPSSTCAMGAVVDDRFRVLGVDGLRVVDASVMPEIVRANLNATVVMMAERAAAMILGG